MKLESLRELYVAELKDLYYAENQLLKALPMMAKAATAPALKKGFEKHLEETKGQVERLERIFKDLDESPKGTKCKAMEGLIEEGSELMEEDAEPEVMDAALIAAAQRVEHYDIAQAMGAFALMPTCSARPRRPSCSRKRSMKKARRTKL